MENGLVQATEEGTPQGGPLSPLLSNIVLDELDQELTRRGHCFVRYADDCHISVRSQKAAERTLASVTQFVERKLRLKVNRKKIAVDRPWKRKFLGFSFTMNRIPPDDEATHRSGLGGPVQAEDPGVAPSDTR